MRSTSRRLYRVTGVVSASRSRANQSMRSPSARIKFIYANYCRNQWISCTSKGSNERKERLPLLYGVLSSFQAQEDGILAEICHEVSCSVSVLRLPFSVAWSEPAGQRMDHTMSYAVTSARPPGAMERVLIALAFLLLVIETLYVGRNVYVLFQLSMDSHQSAFLESTLTEVMRGVLLLLAAYQCVMRPSSVLHNGMIPAVLVIPYGIWLAYSSGRVMMSVSGAFQGDDIALGFLSGSGLIAIGVLVVSACQISAYRRRRRLRAFRS
jgi:hypothetical protein